VLYKTIDKDAFCGIVLLYLS